MIQTKTPAAITRALYSMIAGLLIGIGALALFLLHDMLREQAAVDSVTFQLQGETSHDGVIAIEPPIAGQDFTLMNQHGAEVHLGDLQGRHILLTFGFARCPDICPLTLHDFQRMQAMLGEQAEQMHFVFVSVDGSRDTPAALKQYLSFRGFEDIIALTGSEQSVRNFGEPLGLAFEISDDDAPGGYLVNHTAGLFLLDQQGRWILRYHFGVPPETVVRDLRRLLHS